MTGPQIVTSLRSMMLTTKDQIAAYQAKTAEAETLAVHLHAVITYLERGSYNERIEAGMRASVAGIYSRRGELFARCVQVLRDHGPVLSTPELVTHCLRAKNLDPDDKLVRGDMSQRVITVLKMREVKGEVVAAGKQGLAKLWRLPEG